MDKRTAEQLAQATSRFYAEHAASFSATRARPWAGWYRCADMLVELAGARGGGGGADVKRGGAGTGGRTGGEAHANGGLELLDLACGNLRFERFMHEAHPQTPLSMYAVDGDDALVFDLAHAMDAAGELSYQHLDIVEALQTERALTGALEAPVCDAAVCFGFMHHVPQFLWRRRLLDALVRGVRPGGLVFVTLWQFADDADRAAKASETTQRAAEELGIDEEELGEGDYILGWQDAPGAWRYCHHFSDSEIDRLAAEQEANGKAKLAASFSADGKGGRQNRYLVLRRL